ncbi:MAG: hypothetical protein PVF58_08270 [Candidatus Methanofastidiosia archaeon]|jgi:hypothetical protein
MNKKLICTLLLAVLLVSTAAVLATPGEDSDCLTITTNLGWETPLGKEGGDEGVFLGICGEDSD